jgi:hypothetical protein
LGKYFNLQNFKYIVYFSELLPLFFYLIFARKYESKDKRVFFLYLVVISILIVIGFSSLYVLKNPELYFLCIRVYNFLEYTLLCYFFSLFITNKPIKQILLYSPFAFILFCVYDFVNASKPEIPFLPLSIEYIFLLALIIFFLFEEMQKTYNEPIYEKAVFWISVAFLLNFAGNFFLFLYSKNRFVDADFQKNYTIIYGTVTLCKNFFLCVSAYVYKKNNKNKKKSIQSSMDFLSLQNSSNPNY